VGLDQYAYVAGRAGQRDEWWEGAAMNPETKQFENPAVTQPRELAYWRKHPNLQGWMEQLWRSRNKPNNNLVQEDRWGSGFNGIELELTWQDLDRLEKTSSKDDCLPRRDFSLVKTATNTIVHKTLSLSKEPRPNYF